MWGDDVGRWLDKAVYVGATLRGDVKIQVLVNAAV